MTQNNVAFIPVRGGSKSIPLKNIKLMNNYPLIYWTMSAAVKSKYIDQVYISTDSEIIANKVDELKNLFDDKAAAKIVCITRSAETATDEASTESALMEFAEKYTFKHVFLIQATSPLLTFRDLDCGYEKFLKGKYDSLLSVVRQKRFIWEERDGSVIPVNYQPEGRPRRQEFSGYLVENGAFYVTSKPALLESGVRISGNIGHYEMSEDSYFEIDEPQDWNIVEQLLKRSGKNELEEKVKNIKLVAMDSDGVLTDAGMYYTEQGDEIKKFNTKDGMGVSLLHAKGIKTAIITGENSKAVKRRGEKLGIEQVYLGVKNKVKVIDELAAFYNLTYQEIAYIGDDINDLEVLRKVGLSFSVEDALSLIKNEVDYVTAAKGGQGAVREVTEFFLSVLDNKK
ncbi:MULTISPECIES: acylneuraminate cytidylyltransferase [Sediminibacillus]|uniref:acylneuraminate cytidylyltransferase n=1 Tax=Sediminibacillus TaxID=482460 RepID=UPI0012979D19|nr:acylneuraminate cytidylyltransferase [Sediminibacillus terrae]